MKGKEVFKKLVNIKSIIAIIVVTIIAVLSGINIVQYNSHNAQTELGEAQQTNVIENTSWNPVTIGIEPADIIKQAISLANNTSSTYAGGCIGFTNEVIKKTKNGAANKNTTLQGLGSSNWDTSTINGLKVGTYVKKYTTNANMTNGGKKWFDEIGVNRLQPGDIIIGEGHSMIYLGKATNYETLKSNLKNTYGITFSDGLQKMTTGGEGSRTYYHQYTDDSVKSDYWTIDVNGNGNHVRISNYNWTVAAGKSSNLNNMHVYRFKKVDTKSIKLNIVKQDMNGNKINGAKFEYWESDTIINMPTENTGTEGTSISLSNIKYGTTRYVWIREKEAPTNYIKTLNNPIEIKVSVDSEGKTSIQKIHNGGQDQIIGTYFGGFTDGNKTTSKDNEVLSDCKDNISVIIKNPRIGNYHINLGKKSSENPDGNFVANVKYNVYMKNNNKTGTTEYITDTTEKNISGNIDITNLDDDNYVFTEEDAVSAGYVKKSGSYGVNVHKEIIDGVYKIKNITYYSGLKPTTYKSMDIEKGETCWIQSDGTAIKNPTNEQKKSAVAYIKLSENSGAFAYVGINEPITGDYNMKIIKRDESSTWNTYTNSSDGGIGGAEFEVKQYLNKEDFDFVNSIQEYLNKYTPNNSKPVKTVENNWSSLYDEVKISKDDYNLVDIYSIKESSAPDGYEKNDNTMYLKVKKKLQGSKYYIDKVSMLSAADGSELEDNGGYFRIEQKDGYTTITNDGWKFRVVYNNTEIYVAIADSPINSYNLKIFKRSTTNTEDRNATTVGGAKFDIKQYKNNSNSYIDPSNSDSEIEYTTDPNSNGIIRFNKDDKYNDGNGNVLLYQDESGKTDKYLIKETESPIYYNKPEYFSENKENYILIEVNKVKKDGRIVISDVNVYAYKKSSSGYLKEKIQNFDNSITPGTSYEYDGKYNIRVGLNENGTEIVIRLENKPVDGEYDLQIGKKSTENYKNNNDSDFLSGFKYTINQYAGISSNIINQAKNDGIKIDEYLEAYFKSNKKDYTIDIKESGKAYSATNGDGIKSTGYNLFDYHVIKEESTTTNFYKDDNKYILVIEKEVTGDDGNKQVKIKEVKVYDNSGNIITTSNGTYNDNVTKESSTFKIYYNSDTTIFVHADTPIISGEYNMNIIKKSMEDNSVNLSNVQEGAKFSVKQYKNGATDSITGYSKNDKGYVVTEKGVKTDIYYGDSNKVKIDDILSVDRYEISEVGAPTGYECSNLKLEFKVQKVRSGFSYKIGKVEVILPTGNVIANYGTIKLDKSNKVVDNSSSEYVVSLTVSETSIEVIWKDYRIGEYQLKARKIDQNGNSISGAQFKLTKATDSTTNLFGNSGLVYSSGSSKGYTTTYYQQLTKDNIDGEDAYVLTEVTSPKNYVKLKYPIKLSIVKDKTTYKLEKVKIKVNNSDTETECVLGNKVTINDVLLENDVKVKIIVSIESTGTVTIQVSNAEINGKYSFNMHKTINGKEAKGISFEISGNTNINTTAITNEAGNTNTFARDISKEDVGTTDIITIKESEPTDKSILYLKNAIKLNIKKGLNSKKDSYIAKEIKAWEDGKTEPTTFTAISESMPTKLTISGMALNDEKTNVDVTISISNSSDNPIITVNIENKTIEPKTYRLQLKKINGNNNLPINNRKFKVYKINSDGSRTDLTADGPITSSNGGIVNINKVFELQDNITDKYAIQEYYDDDYNNEYVKITNYEWIVKLNKTGNSLDTYALATPVITYQLKENAKADLVQANIAKKATIKKSGTDEAMVSITIQNVPTINYSFVVNKVDEKGNELDGSKFTITRQQNSTHKEESITGDPNGKSIVTENVSPGETFNFIIKEDNAPSGYKKLFSNNQGYLSIPITIDVNGNVVVNENNIIWEKGISNINDIISNYLKNTGKTSIVNVNNNGSSHTIEINLPNTVETTSTSLNLNKYAYGNKNEKIAGIKFDVKKATVRGLDVTGVSNIVRNLNTYGENMPGFVTSESNDSSIDDMQSATANTTYLYQISETSTTYNKTIEKAIIKIYVDNDKVAHESIVAVWLKGTSGWSAYSSSLNYSDRISIETTGKNSYRINWANDLIYGVQIIKKSISGDISDLPKDSDGNIKWTELSNITANFTVKQTKPDVKIIATNEKFNSKVDINENAKVDETYTYEITENKSSDGYMNLFENKTIVLNVTIDKDKNISTSFSIKGASGSSEQKYLSQYIKVELEDNIVNIYIVNPKESIGLKLLKVSDSKENGIENVSFSVSGMGSSQQVILGQKTYTTDSSGMANISDDIGIYNQAQTYIFTETSVPGGVTKIENTQIWLTIDTTDVKSIKDLTSDKIKLRAVMTGANGVNDISKLGITAEIIGKSVVLVVPNETNYAALTLEKLDINGNRITGLNYDTEGNVKKGVKVDITKQSNFKGKSTVYSGYIPEGVQSEKESQIIGNNEYIYEISELQTKYGYENVLDGWILRLHIKTDNNAVIKPINDNESDKTGNNSYFELVKKLESQKYSRDTILKYIQFNIDTTNVKSQKIGVKLTNPPSYKIQLNKKDINGNDAKAEIKAYNKTLYPNAVNPMAELSYKTTYTSGRHMIIEKGETQVWQIEESDTSSPYINILKGKFINVRVNFIDSGLNIISWDIDGDENSEYKKYVNISTEVIDGYWTLVVTVKDPIQVKVRLNKVGNDGKTPLTGAHLSLWDKRSDKTSDKTEYIYGNNTSTNYILREVGSGSVLTYQIDEIQSSNGHINILKDKSLILTFRVDENNDLACVQRIVMKNDGKMLTGTELNDVLKYIKIDYGKDGRIKTIDITVTNPLEYKFKLSKVDSLGNPLSGTQIVVNSSHSGKHYIDENMQLDFMEDEVQEGSTIDYTISELYTKYENTLPETPYVNILRDAEIQLKAQVSEKGELSIVKSCVVKNESDGKTTEASLEEYGVKLNPIKTDENGIQNIEIVLTNTTKFKFEINKTTSGTNSIPLSYTKFTTISSASGSRTGYTNTNGKIEFTESNIKAGDYTIKVFEDKTASQKYINILESNYIEINFNVSADGEVNFKNQNQKYKICQPNGTQIVESTQLEFYEKYISVDIDKTSKVNKISVSIKNPVRIGFEMRKVVASTDTALKDTKFNIISGINNEDYSLKTDENGKCSIEEKCIDPGVYEYEITEIESAGKVYNNILDGYSIIVYVKVSETGDIEFVADQKGTPFTSIPMNKRYYVYQNGNLVDSTDKGKEIRKLVDLGIIYGDYKTALLKVGNPMDYKIDIVKVDSSEKAIGGVKFEVKRSENVIFSKNVSSDPNDVEITEKNMNPGMYTYYITETRIDNLMGVYTNAFNDKAIKVNVVLGADGSLQIISNSNGDKYEIYSIKNGIYTLLDKSDEAYKFVKNIDISKDQDGISILKVEVENPTKYTVRILKQNAIGAITKGSKFTLIKENENGDITTLLNNETLRDIKENNVEAGNYIYYITENSTPTNDDSKPGAQYVNILQGKYMKVYVNIYANGKISINNSRFEASDNYYEVYEGDINTRNGKKVEKNRDLSVEVKSYQSYVEKELNIIVKNPVKYNLDIAKKDTTGKSLANSKFKVRRQVVSTNSNDKIFDDVVTDKVEVTEDRMLAGNYIYYIKETGSPATKYCNILEDGYLKLYVKVYGDGRVTLTNSKFEDSTSHYEWRKGNIDDPKDTDTLVATAGPMGRFVRAYVQESNNVYTINVEVKDPLKLEFGIHKVIASSENNIPNVKFNITNSIWGNTETVITDKDGLASISEEDVMAGIHKFEITEIETASEIYNNLLEGYKIVVYLKITGDGTITFVSNQNGATFSSAVASDKHFHVYKGDTNVDETSNGKAIINLVSLKTQSGEIPKAVLKVGNTLNYKMNLTKKDTENNTLTGSIFEVKRSDASIFNGEVTNAVEITEKNMLPGTYEYYITENSISNKNGTYVNVFKNKAIKVNLNLDNKGVLTIIEKGGKKFEICSVNNGKYTVLNDDIAYQFVKNIEITKDSNGVSIIQVEVENPTNYNFNVIKKDAAENNVKGSKFTAYREDSNGNIKQVLNNEELKIINETPMRAGNYIYYITETATPGKQYVNVLEGKYMKVYVHLDANGRLSITNSKFQVADNYYEIYKGDISKRDGTKVENSEFISVNVSGPQNNVYTLNVVVTNPVKINTNIIKKDTSNNDLAGSHFKVRRKDVSTKTFSDRFEGEVTSGIEKTESPMSAGNYIYYVTEKSSPSARYTNILEKTYLKIYVKISGDGKVVITDSKFNESAGYYEWYNGDINNPKDSDTKIDKSDPRNQYIKDISTSVEDSIYTVNVTVVNPVKIRVNVNKKIFGDDEVNLQNVEIKAETPDGFTGVVTKVTDKDGNISFIDQYANAGLRRYLVTEAKPAGEEFVNVLEHKEILVYTIVKADGTFQIVNEDGVPTENKWYAYNNTDPNNKVKLNENTDVIKNFVKVSQSVGKDKISELNFAIKNPQKYKLHLRKIDKDNKKGMNGVTFDLSVSDGKNIVKLRNANTLENMNTEGLVTSTVDGADGVIEINDILIEKSGTYTYTLHEHSTDGIFDWLYKNHKDDIILRVKIVVKDGKYVIENLETVQGGDYVGDLSIATGIGSTIKNERIKGKYDLILNKVDSYTEKALDGAVFNIHVEKDGKEHTLYKSTEDVDSMEQILPADNVVVKNGKLEIKDIRIEEIGRDRLEEYTIVLTEVTAPKGYMLLDAPIKLKVTTNTTGKFDDEKYIVESVELVDDENHGLVTFDYNENKIVVTAKNEYFDLALRKSITSVAYPDTNEGEITEEETKDRIPEVITDGINEGPNGEDPTETTAVYNHKKNPVRVYKEQEVIYTLRVYNEGEIDGYAEEITDHLPEWLEFVDDDFNKERGWSLDENDETGRTVRTKNLSKAYADENGVDNLIKAKNKVTGDLDSKEIQIKCRVSEKAKLKTVLTNIAEISLSKADDRTSETVDRDSVTNNVKIPETSEEMSKYKDDELNKTYVPGQEDDDDFEKVIVEAFDLSLRKYITAVNDEQMLKDNTDTEDKKQNTQDKNNESTKDENSENTEDKNKVTNDESTNNETTKDEGQEKTDDSQGGNNNDEEQKDTVDDNSADLKYAREPLINIKDLRDKPDDVTTATYTHTKEPVEVSVDDIVTYTISVYNEGTVSGYASLIKDDIPEGLEYVKDSEINKKFNWKLLDENNKETDDVKKAKYIVSDYLSKENGDDNILNAFNGEKLDTKYVQVDFKVICKQDWAKIIKNEAQISDDQDDRGKPVRDRDSTPNEWKGEDDEDVEYIRVTYMDLALRKFITGVNKQIITDRIPEVDATALKNKENTTADYKHTKEPVIVHTNDTVIYTIRVYNEGSKDGYATQIKDDIPEGLEFIPYNETNKMYEWKMLDAEGNETLDVSKVKSVVTNYCSKDKETEKRQNLMLAFERPDGTTFDTPEYKDVKIAFKVVEPTTSDRILINHAQISEQTDKKGIHREDRDSTPNEWKGEDDEDIEKVRVLYFDLALRKWVTKAIVTENGQTVVTETGHHAEDDPEEVVKVDLKKSKINSVVVKFEYQIRITNEGEIAGYAKEIKDRIPDGLEFEEADNPNWKMLEDGTVVTDELKDKLLQPGESAEVTIVLKWINSATNMGVKINVAEISKDYNNYGTPDIDSTPNNNVPGEDDIDDAPVMLTVKTGSQDLKYMLAILVVLTALVGSVSLLKKNLQKNKYN